MNSCVLTISGWDDRADISQISSFTGQTLTMEIKNCFCRIWQFLYAVECLENL